MLEEFAGCSKIYIQTARKKGCLLFPTQTVALLNYLCLYRSIYKSSSECITLHNCITLTSMPRLNVHDGATHVF